MGKQTGQGPPQTTPTPTPTGLTIGLLTGPLETFRVVYKVFHTEPGLLLEPLGAKKVMPQSRHFYYSPKLRKSLLITIKVNNFIISAPTFILIQF